MFVEANWISRFQIHSKHALRPIRNVEENEEVGELLPGDLNDVTIF
jgi:hypothetical protein